MNANERLWDAIEDGSVVRVKNALKAGADVNDKDEDGHIPLMSACYFGHLEIVKLLLKAGADANRWAQGDTPLGRAAAGGHREIYELLHPIVTDEIRTAVTEEDLVSGEIRSARESDEVVEPFINAAMMGDLEQLEAGLAAGVDVNAIGSHGNGALHYAAVYGRLPVVERLLAAGADTNLRLEEEGLRSGRSTPLMLAASSSFSGVRPAVIRRLLEAGADIDAGDDSGRTALMHAVEDGMGCMDSVEALIEAGATLDAVDEHGNTALMFAVSRSRDAMIATLRAAGASEAGLANVQLMQASEAGDLATVQKLLASGSADVNCLMHTRPLARACQSGHANIVGALLAAGADVNLPDARGYFTPLIQAASGGHVEAVRLLLGAGADVTAEVEGVGTALDYALMAPRAKRNEVIELLEAAGTPSHTKAKRQRK
jgi:ankyrin repeat protein